MKKLRRILEKLGSDEFLKPDERKMNKAFGDIMSLLPKLEETERLHQEIEILNAVIETCGCGCAMNKRKISKEKSNAKT